MRKVIDCSALDKPELPAFLAASRHNYALLTDACQKEAFAAGPGVQRLLKPFDDRPGQAVLLMPTWHVWRLRPKPSGFFSKFVDREQTAAFPSYCRLLMAGNETVMANVLKQQLEAQAFIARLLEDAGPLQSQMGQLIGSYSVSDLKVLRSGKQLTTGLCERITKDVADDTAHRLREAQGKRVHPSPKEIKASLIFRFSVCHCALAIRRASAGGLRGQSVETFRNDLNDCIYASYATLFDGLITDDGGLIKTYNLALMLLHRVFDCRAVTAEPVPE